MSPQYHLLDGRRQSYSWQRGSLIAKTNGTVAPALATHEGMLRMQIPMLANETMLLGSVAV